MALKAYRNDVFVAMNVVVRTGDALVDAGPGGRHFLHAIDDSLRRLRNNG